jgi:peroxiredoxin
MPELVKWQKEYRARGLQIIGVTYEPERRSGVRRTMRRFKLNYPVLIGTSKVAEAYDAGDVLPTTIIVDQEGKIRGRILGILDAEDFKQRVEPLLKVASNGNEK